MYVRFVLAHGDSLPGPSFEKLAKQYQQAARHPVANI